MSTQSVCLVVEVGAHLCAVPLDATIETLRPLPLERLPGAPRGLVGLSMIRGVTAPVVDLACLFDEPESAAGRWVLVRAGGGRLALAVSRVVGVDALDEAREGLGHALAARARAPFIAAVATSGGRVVAVLDVARVLPEAAPRGLSGAGVSEHG